MTDHALQLLLEFDACSQRDKGQAPVFLHRRDRKFALTCEEQGVEPSAERWMAQMNHLSGPGAGISPSEQLFRFWRRVNATFIAAGSLFGVLTMLGLLFYDGGQRINITVFLAFVAFQILLALLTTVQSLLGWQPWHALLRRFRNNPTSTVSTKLQPVLMARAAQLGGMCFSIAGLTTLLLMVVLQDLAFGWSTTLETDSSSYHSMINLLATPWSWLWPAASPDIALVDATRFFRASSANNNINPAQWGQWWPFVAMLWTTWALLPRLILYILAGVVIQRKAQQLMSSHPAMRALLYRMETPALDTGNDHNDSEDQPNTDTQLRVKPLPSANITLCWAGAGDSDLPSVLRSNKSLIGKIGGRMTLAEDQQVLDQVALQLAHESNHCVLLLTRSWEPPTGELEDFLVRAKESWPKDAHIVFVPLATDNTLEPNFHQVQQWLRFAKRTNPDFVTVSLVPIDANVPRMDEGVMQ